MKTIFIRPVQDKDINFFLSSRNLLINRKFSKNKKAINKLDHYNWWFNNNNRKSHIVEKGKEKLMILTEETYKLGKLAIIYTGLISCKEKIDLMDLLKAVKWQNQNILRHKKGINIISVVKKNYFGNLQSKYFKFSKLKKSSALYKKISKKIKLNENFKTYFKVIN